MRVQIADNVSRNMASVLSPAIRKFRDIRIAVAFVSKRGLTIIEPSIKVALRSQTCIEFLIGLDAHLTEPEALETLFELSQNTANVGLYCYASLSSGELYHPKVYLFKNDNEACSIIGSSNLTEGGLRKNVEVNAIIEGNIRDEVISDIYDTYNLLKFHQKRVVPDKEFLAIYSELCGLEKKQRRRAEVNKSSRSLMTIFNEKVDSLIRPKATRRDCVGWLELVYDSLPEGEFTNLQVYRYEKVFQQHYPENRNIKDKIRQQLQTLRDMGLIEHLGTGRWRKI